MSRTASRTAPEGLRNLGKLRMAGVVLISLVGLVHLLVTPEYFEFAAYLGLLIFANFAGSIISAVGIYQSHIWGWWLGVVMASGAFLAYIQSRTLGLPGLPSWEPFTEPGLFSLLVEAIFLGVAAYVLVRRRKASALWRSYYLKPDRSVSRAGSLHPSSLGSRIVFISLKGRCLLWQGQRSGELKNGSNCV